MLLADTGTVSECIIKSAYATPRSMSAYRFLAERSGARIEKNEDSIAEWQKDRSHRLLHEWFGHRSRPCSKKWFNTFSMELLR